MEGNIYKYTIGTLKDEEAIHSVPASDYWLCHPQKALLDIKVGQRILKQRFIIAEMTSPVILRFDFIRDQECIIDGGKALVWVGGELIPCQARQDAPATFPVTLDQTITVPALTERLVEANINGHPHYTCAIMEPSEALINRKQVLIAKSVVDPGGGEIFGRRSTAPSKCSPAGASPPDGSQQ